MKKTIMTYLISIFIFFIPFVLISFIFAVLSYFIQLHASFIEIFIQILSYFFLLISAFYFTSQITHKRLTHCLCMSLLYFLMSLLIHLGNIHYIHLFAKSLLFIVIGMIKEIKKSGA